QSGGAVSPERLNAAIQWLDETAQREIDANAVPGIAIAVVFQDELVYANGFGVRDTGTGAPVDADTVFQLASVSKPIGSTIVAALVGDGKITWDSRISDLDPGFEMYDPWVTREITIRDFYCHRSGLPDHAGDLLEDLGFTREEILHRLRYQRPDTSFRSGYAYTNFGLTEASIAAAKAYGLEWEDAAEQKLYRPLGMTSTSSRHDDFVARENKALGHVLIDGRWVQKYQRDPDTESPAGGVSSSVNDLAKWLRLQLANGRFDGTPIVAEAPLAATHLPQIMVHPSSASGVPQFYGLGWNVNYDDRGRLRLSHSGAFDLGAGTNASLSPSDQLGIVVLTNGAPVGVAEGLAATFMDTALYGEPTRDWLKLYQDAFDQMIQAERGADYSKPPESPLPPSENAAYVGTYENSFFGEIAVIEKGGGLAIVQGPHDMTFAMTHYDRDVFTYETEGESAIGTAGITFTLGADGKAIEVVVENLDVNGEGTFRRVLHEPVEP
ncbi:MAG TPA: serine hydrolase, partial [Geminicoccaceae bacterium]|nr:serine hydrolase [Geminicoccaceae bacterium]